MGVKTLSENFATAQVSVGTTAVKIWSAQSGIDEITIQNVTGTALMYLGGPNVSASNGFPLQAVAGSSLTLTSTADIWAVSASGSQTAALIWTS